MYFTSFAEAVPEIGTSETRVLHISENSEVPFGSYAFVECFCSDPECDCQIVRLVVMGLDGQEHACISYGWNDKTFYDEAFSGCDHNFPGPDFAVLTPQGSYADFFLDICKKFLIQDKAFVERLKRHHDLFKQEARKRDLSEGLMIQKRQSLIQKLHSLGRNDLCLCGSGKKYKKCCIRR